MLAPTIAQATADRCLSMLESRADENGTLTVQGMKNQVGLLRSEMLGEISALFEKHLGLAAQAAGGNAARSGANGLNLLFTTGTTARKSFQQILIFRKALSRLSS